MQTLSSQDVIERLGRGEALTLDATYSLQSVFSDGTRVPHQVMLSLVDRSMLVAPVRRGLAWRLSSDDASHGQDTQKNNMNHVSTPG